MVFQVSRATTTDNGSGLLEVLAWPVREGLSNNRLQQTARWQFAAPLLNRVLCRPRQRSRSRA
jgi:hypothetical protein